MKALVLILAFIGITANAWAEGFVAEVVELQMPDYLTPTAIKLREAAKLTVNHDQKWAKELMSRADFIEAAAKDFRSPMPKNSSKLVLNFLRAGRAGSSIRILKFGVSMNYQYKLPRSLI